MIIWKLSNWNWISDKMRYIILAFGIISIAIVTVLNFYPDETKEFIYNLFLVNLFIANLINILYFNE